MSELVDNLDASNLIGATELAKDCYRDYGKYVLDGRATPSIIDGLKDVKRRLVETANEMPAGLNKSSDIVGQTMRRHPHGDCLSGDTKVILANGLVKTLKQLYEDGNPQDIICYDETTNQIKVERAHSFRIGQITNKIYHVKLSDGSEIKCTSNHPFYVTSTHEWTRAEDLQVGDPLKVISYEDDWSPDYRPVIHDYETRENRKLQTISGFSAYEESRKEGEVDHHKDFNSRNNFRSNIERLSKPDHALVHKDYLKGLDNGRDRMINGDLKELNHSKNSSLMTSYNNKQGMNKAILLIRYMMENNIIISRENYEKLRNDKSKFYNYPLIDRMIERGQIADFSELVALANSDYKFVNEEEIAYFKSSEEQTAYIESRNHDESVRRRILNGAMMVLEYLRSNGLGLSRKQYEKYQSKLYYSTQLETLDDYYEYEDVINIFESVLPEVKSIEVEEVEETPMYDFTVDTYHNMFIMTSETVNRVGFYNLVCVHNSAIYGALVNMTYSGGRFPLFDGHGNFGTIDDEAAAMRYTEAKLSDIAKIIYTQLIDSSHKIIGESGHEESKNLPCLLPYALLAGDQGMGIGISTQIFPLNAIELLDCYVSYLEGTSLEDLTMPKPDFGELVLLNSRKEIQQIVRTGQGQLKYKSLVHQESETTFVIYNLPPKKSISQVNNRLRGLIEDEVIDFRNESVTTPRYVYEIINNSKITGSEVKALLEKYTTASFSYSWLFSEKIDDEGDEVVGYYTGLPYIIQRSSEYTESCTVRKFTDRVNSLKKEIDVLEAIEAFKTTEVCDDIKHHSQEDCIKAILEFKNEDGTQRFSEEVAQQAISRRSISYLTNSYLKQIEDTRKQLKEAETYRDNPRSYMLELYADLREKLVEMYKSRKVSVYPDELLLDPRVKLSEDKTKLIISDDEDGISCKNTLYIVTEEGTFIPKYVNYSTRYEIDITSESTERISAIDSGEGGYIVALVNRGAIFVFDKNRIQENRKLVKLDEGDIVTDVKIQTSNIMSLLDDKGERHEINLDDYIRSRYSYSIDLGFQVSELGLKG